MAGFAQPQLDDARRLKGATAAILAVGVIASGTHLAPNGTAVAKAPSGAP